MPIKLFGGIRPLGRSGVLRDLLAGASAASINIPQVLGYARIAGTPVVTGLYTLLLPLVAYAVFGSSRHLIVAADSATAAIFSSSLSQMAPAGERYMALVGMVTLLTAGLLLVARLFKLGFLADFLSRTVLVGFLTGVGVQVAAAMLSDMSGVAVDSRYTLVRAWEVMHGLRQPNMSTLALSTLVAGGILLGNRFAARVPLALIAVVAAIAASSTFDFAHQGIAVIGAVPGGLPTFRLPRVTASDILALLPVAASCVVVIIAQSAATSRAFGLRYQEDVDSDADILGLAAANTAASLSGTFVVNGSPTQTAMADRLGARSQIAQLALAAVVLVVLLVLTGPLEYLPRCVLAGIVFSIAVSMIDVAQLRAIRRESPGEFYLAVTTAATVVTLGVEQGILLAIVLSLFRHVRHSYRPHTMMLAPDAAGMWVPIPATPGKVTEPGLIAYRFGADLFYANAPRFADEVRALVRQAPAPVRWFIVDCSAITDIDYSAAQVMRDLLNDLAQRHIRVLFARVSPYLRSDMHRHSLTPVVGEGCIFGTLHEALATVSGGMSPRASVLALVVALLPLGGIAPVRAATTTAPATAAPIYIRDVTVIDTETGKEAPHRTVKISGGRISAVIAGRAAAASPGARIVKASGKFLIPGLWDMHVHGNNQSWFADFFPLYLANGVTGIREMFGPANAGQFRAELAARNIDAPRIYLASPIVDGYPPVWPKSISVKTPGEARHVVDEQARNGADFIKVYSMLSREEYFAIIDEAKKKHIDVEGHVPRRISIWEATAANQKSIEHLNGIGLGCSGREEELWPKVVAAKSAEEVDRLVVDASRSYDDDKCRRLFAEFKKNRTWPVPTLVVRRSFASLNDPKFTRDERAKYFRGEARRWLVADDDFPLRNKSDEYFKLQRDYFAFEKRLVGELFRAGVPMLAGTDAGNPYCFPGFSLHDELAMRVEAGVSPLAALQEATRNPALFMGAADKYGSVKPGRVADLVLLDADPLLDIHNTARIAAVFLGGKEFDRAALDGLLRQAERTASADR